MAHKAEIRLTGFHGVTGVPIHTNLTNSSKGWYSILNVQEEFGYLQVRDWGAENVLEMIARSSLDAQMMYEHPEEFAKYKVNFAYAEEWQKAVWAVGLQAIHVHPLPDKVAALKVSNRINRLGEPFRV